MPGYHERCPRQPPWTGCRVSRAPRRDRGRHACQLAGQTGPRVLPAPRQDRRAEGVGQTTPRWAPLSGSARHARLALHAGTTTPRRPRRSGAPCSMRVTHRHRARQDAGRSRRQDQHGPISRAGGYLPSATTTPDVSLRVRTGIAVPPFSARKPPGTEPPAGLPGDVPRARSTRAGPLSAALVQAGLGGFTRLAALRDTACRYAWGHPRVGYVSPGRLPATRPGWEGASFPQQRA